MKPSQEDVLLPVSTSSQHKRSTKFNRLLSVVSLISLAGTLTLVQRYSNGNVASFRPFSSKPDLLSPADQWKDDIWPLREHTPWDISTDYPFPRLLEYDVTEGTWLRLDVHPKSGDIVFDILGDIYCLPGDAYSKGKLDSDTITKAKPVLLGIPHDSDPHFSPEGDRLVFRSDAGLGVENIWITEWKGCANMDVRSENPSPELVAALKNKNAEEEELAQTLFETEERKVRRLTREGRLNGMSIILRTLRLDINVNLILSIPGDQRNIPLGL